MHILCKCWWCCSFEVFQFCEGEWRTMKGQKQVHLLWKSIRFLHIYLEVLCICYVEVQIRVIVVRGLTQRGGCLALAKRNQSIQDQLEVLNKILLTKPHYKHSVMGNWPTKLETCLRHWKFYKSTMMIDLHSSFTDIGWWRRTICW